ncbi:MAG: hypothetical protein EOL88_07000 [Bacteroidia bacterium]|nr:hypothetical protein [Bacteroidales bacterium]MDD3011328.1 hypothetical protein [Bacteroidales bacterium]MDD3962147.1 hypothetical protein [Bacteroidales bacterium]NCD41823.1 hypothetical protein [Bacteroidia bacterium]HPG11699.1 hypothetical protein [Chitinophagaceae bacterium]
METIINIFQHKKKLVYGLLILIIVIILWKQGKKFLQKVSSKSLIKEAEQTVQEDNLTYPVEQYQIFSDRLFTAMNGIRTDEDAVYDVLSKMITKDDMLKLIATFGHQEDTEWGIFRAFNTNGNLITWLQNELSDKEKEKVSEYFKKCGLEF